MWLCKDVATIIKQLADPYTPKNIRFFVSGPKTSFRYTYFNLLRTAKVFQPEQPKQRKEQLVKLLVVGKELVNQYLVRKQ